MLATGPLKAGDVQPSANIYMFAWNDTSDYTQPVKVRVYDYNQVAGDNFQVYFKRAGGGQIMPPTDVKLLTGRETGVIGSPVAGKTNLQNLNQYGIAFAGALSPPNALNRAPRSTASSVRSLTPRPLRRKSSSSRPGKGPSCPTCRCDFATT